MILVLYKDKQRVTALVKGVHAPTMEELMRYAEAKFEFDECLEMTEKAYAKTLAEESRADEPTADELEKAEILNQLKAEEEIIKQTMKEFKEDYLLAKMQGDEELAQSIIEEYQEWRGGQNE